MGVKNIILTNICDSSITLGWGTTDNRADTLAPINVAHGGMGVMTVSSPQNLYDIGKTSEGVNIGAYSFSLDTDSVTADSVAVDAVYSQYHNSVEVSNRTKLTGGTSQGNIRTFTIAEAGTLIPKAFKKGDFSMSVSASIQGIDTLAITNNTDLDGSATIYWSIYHVFHA